MSSGEKRASEWLAGLRLAPERLLHTRGSGSAAAGEVRFLALLLLAPFVLSAMVAQAAMAVSTAAMALAAVCAVFATSWLLGLLAIEKIGASAIRIAALAGGSLAIGISAGLLGGVTSPAACMALAAPIEAMWVLKSKRAAVAAFGGAVAAMVAGSLLGGGEASAWQWLTPLAYGGLLAGRWFSGSPAEAEAPAERPFDIDAVDAAVFRLGAGGEVEAVGGAGRGMLNVDPALLLGGGLFDRIHVADRVAFLCAVSEARQQGGSRSIEMKLRRAANHAGDDQGGFGLCTVELVRAAGDETGMWAIVRDAATMAELRRELARAVEQTNATDVAKGRFLATVSHELRTPLNAIIGFSDMLLHREISGELSVKQAEHVGLIREAGNHLLSVVNAILDVSKIESGSYQIAIEPFELGGAVELCCAMLEPQAAEKGVTLTGRVPAGLAPVQGDQRAVQQILLNLVSNAIKFTPEGGSVSVNAAQGAGVVRLFVNDTGIGIAADDLARLGRPFMQVHNDYTRQFQGTGLGLSLVKGLVRLQGGTMSVESAPGLGTTVTIGLPVASQSVREPAGEWTRQGEHDGTALRRIA